MEEKVLGHRSNKRGKAINSVTNLSHTLYVVDDAKAVCSILYSSGNTQIKSCWCPADHPSVTISLQKPQYPEG